MRDVQRSTVDHDFLRTFDIAILTGRPLRAGDQDRGSADVVLVNRAFVSRVLGDGDALGRRIRYLPDNPADPHQAAPARWYEIVGVVENIDANPYARERVDPRVYHPLKGVEGSRAALAVRSAAGEQGSLAARVRQIAASVDPALAVDVVPLESVYRAIRSALRAAALAVGIALLSVLLLSAAGIYALMSFTVTQRRREIAIRTALGARPGRLLRGIFSAALRQISLGIAIGLAVTLLIDGTSDGEALRGNGTALLAAMVVVMSVVGLAAAIGPARRGLRIEPAEALKGQ
jgi:hypothetical protein